MLLGSTIHLFDSILQVRVHVHVCVCVCVCVFVIVCVRVGYSLQGACGSPPNTRDRTPDRASDKPEPEPLKL
jgi:hypothetical protein